MFISTRFNEQALQSQTLALNTCFIAFINNSFWQSMHDNGGWIFSFSLLFGEVVVKYYIHRPLINQYIKLYFITIFYNLKKTYLKFFHNMCLSSDCLCLQSVCNKREPKVLSKTNQS